MKYLDDGVNSKLLVISDDTLSLIGDQTSYMSICVGEKKDEELQHLSVEQLRLKVSYISKISIRIRCQYTIYYALFFSPL